MRTARCSTRPIAPSSRACQCNRSEHPVPRDEHQSDISPIWNPEAFFNTMVVNGMTWPMLEVASRALPPAPAEWLQLALPEPGAEGRQSRRHAGCRCAFLPDRRRAEPAAAGGQGGDRLQDGGTALSRRWDWHAGRRPQEALLMGLAERADVIVDFAASLRAPDPHDQHRPGCPVRWLPGCAGGSCHHRSGDAVRGRGPTTDEPPTRWTPSTPPAASLELSLVDPVEAGTPSTVTRDLALLEEESVEVCVTIKPTARSSQIGNVKAGPTFLADCAAAGGVPFAPKAAVLGDQGSTGGHVHPVVGSHRDQPGAWCNRDLGAVELVGRCASDPPAPGEVQGAPIASSSTARYGRRRRPRQAGRTR